MCRFVAYLGKEPILLHEILGKHENSLIEQSRCSLESQIVVNGDGFGVGWFDFSVKNGPALFKSIRPAWNDQNLKHLTSIVRSSCFIGHVRASTVGVVNLENCHPFSFDRFLFVHNGTIEGFDKIKRPLINLLSDPIYQNLKGQTDSEHFFALILQNLQALSGETSLENMHLATLNALQTLKDLQMSHCGKTSYKINIAFTDGQRLLVLKTNTPDHETPLSLYYAKAPYALICSEKLWENKEENWVEIPSDHFYLVNENCEGELISLKKDLQ